MKLSWTSLKISIAGAKLSHLVQKDKIWDHGSMAEQARIIFYLVHKARRSGDIESLKKQCSVAYFEKLKDEMKTMNEDEVIKEPMIKELAVLEVKPGKNNKPDMFTAIIKNEWKEESKSNNEPNQFFAYWSFVRQGEWWLLDNIKAPRSIF